MADGLYGKLNSANSIRYTTSSFNLKMIEDAISFLNKRRKEEINVPIYYTIIIEDKPFENFFSARIEMDNFSKVLGIYKFIDFLLKLGNLNNSKIIYNDEELIIDSFTPHDLMLKLNNSIKIAKENNNKNDK